MHYQMWIWSKFENVIAHFLIAMMEELIILYYVLFLKSVYLIATRDLSNLWLQFFLSQNQGFMRLFEKTVLK